jgi:NAD-dependent deacetylase
MDCGWVIILKIATPAFRKDPKLVLDFYNMRRKDVAAAIPNTAHDGIAALEKEYAVTIITQNIDDLHERAGSSCVMHLHGEIFKMRSSVNETLISEIRDDINLGDLRKMVRNYVRILFGLKNPPMINSARSRCFYINVLHCRFTSSRINRLAPDKTPKYIIDKKYLRKPL